ncbi:UNVERIFIED_CONTAM: hypothetical protein GTU68_042023, partial [Idotea baltica]|nr:hypothetical protein [Idotea baltica]
VNPLEDGSLDGYRHYSIDVTKLTRECLKESGLGTKERDRSKNMFVLGFLYWMYNRDLKSTLEFLEAKFNKKKDILEANVKTLKAGYHYGETTETFTTRYEVEAAKKKPGVYRNIMGNQALAIGLVAAGQKANLPIFYGSYPITPASDILHELSKHKNFGVKTFQAEDEIAAVCAAMGASYGGNIGVTATSGPGIALKSETVALATMMELPLVIIDVQRAGPSTGLPTKTEQSDLLAAYHNRSGDCPMPVLAAKSPSDCFFMAIEACRIAIEFMTPVILLSDGYIANGAEPWSFPSADDIPAIKVDFKKDLGDGEEVYKPYKRNDQLSREWAVPGTAGLEHRLGGLEKEHETGNVSYDPANHEFMVKLRAQKVENVANSIPDQDIEIGEESGDVLVLGWGSTFGCIKASVGALIEEGCKVSHAQVRYMRPFPSNMAELFGRFKTILIPEINNGQLVEILKSRYDAPFKSFCKIQGIPITIDEMTKEIKNILDA